ncbi:MAG: hypothetical protein U5R06_11340 [candidate division KSB1 bacterium]|nr:hypothetical protein [candidate division KSB1 bacterium]
MDPTQLDTFTLSLITQKKMLDINQNSTGNRGPMNDEFGNPGNGLSSGIQPERAELRVWRCGCGDS